MSGARILVVDDEKNVRRLLVDILTDEGHFADAAAHVDELRQKLDEKGADLVLLDVCLPGEDGLAWLRRRQREEGAGPSVIMMSGHGTIETALQAVHLGAVDFLEKPIQPDRLLLSVENALRLGRLREENERLRRESGSETELLGDCEPMRRLREQVAKVASTDATVLVTGENGTGKELVARALHRLSPRSEGPYVRLNCAAIPRELLESELFGHEKGAFTGAVQRRRGRFEVAQRGTLLLDEIGDLDLGLQAKLLRVIEERELVRVGGEEPLPLDVRILASTNRDLPEQVRKGQFREDLFYRLNVISLRVPSLSERGPDILALAEHFLEEFAREHGRTLEGFSEPARACLLRHRWPGNVRELRNAVERVVIMSEGPVVEADDLDVLAAGQPPRVAGADAQTRRPLREQIEAFEREIIQRALLESEGNLAEAARRLGVDRGNLHRRCHRLGIERALS